LNREDQFEEYTRRQYLAKKPMENPFGDPEVEATKFSELDVLTRVCSRFGWIAECALFKNEKK